MPDPAPTATVLPAPQQEISPPETSNRVPNSAEATPETADEKGSSRLILLAPLQRFSKYVPALVAAVVVIGVVGIIRLTASPTSGSLTPTTVTTTTGSPLIPVSSNTKGTYFLQAQKIDAANVTLTRALAVSGQSVAAVTADVAPYATTLTTFESSIRSLQWPTALQVPSQDVAEHLQQMVTQITTVSSVTPTTLSAWIAQLKAIAAEAQITDNLVRKDIGLSTTTSYP